ncbi:helix-turn-helix domain-containing protein [Streptomyces albipurpureus]|uniref:Helix-turn-helix domain-containing protein n=1 Tax=Streptomyces albipurpureus TaxID=2897419 RepID=A0ABT0V0M7_9ACTN|nr:helix-turn-helix domain-containing protein [Streptomyces sp. CWNU-1]MCM2393113.1 helix-turn-helix domain-containing protein [Streptomyces sp. CWNU-1]
MDTQHLSVPSHAPSGDAETQHDTIDHPGGERQPYGVTHDNTRHTSRFTIIGNHLAQHSELSLLAIGLGVHIQSLPTGARVDIKSLTARFPEGAARISAALRELEAVGYLRRVRERVPDGRIITRTVSCNQPAARHRPGTALQRASPGRTRQAPPRTRKSRPAPANRAPSERPPTARPPRREPAPLSVPHPGFPTRELLRAATDLLARLHHTDPRLLLSARDTEQLAPGVAAWLEHEASPDSVRHALTTGLPAEELRRPAGLLAHRLTAGLPPAPAFRPPTESPPERHPLQNCDRCDRAFRAPAQGRCRGCAHTHPSDPQP